MANAGNSPPMVCRGDTILHPKVEGIPVGLLEDRPYDEVVFPAQSGDVILLYSDGVPDQLGKSDEEFGVRRISRLLKKHRGRPAAEIVGAFFKELDEFAGEVPISDDQSLIVMKVI
jgi:phosphoserine phosphatase RsbU/P